MVVHCLRHILFHSLAHHPSSPHMARITYKVWSTYPPALYKDPTGFVRIVAGTISKVEVGKTPIPITQRLPESTSLDQLVWMNVPVEMKSKDKPTTTQVAGSKGAVYTITTYPGGRKSCSCPGFMYRRSCKHIS